MSGAFGVSRSLGSASGRCMTGRNPLMSGAFGVSSKESRSHAEYAKPGRNPLMSGAFGVRTVCGPSGCAAAAGRNPLMSGAFGVRAATTQNHDNDNHKSQSPNERGVRCERPQEQ